jgi:hypothetical protein
VFLIVYFVFQLGRTRYAPNYKYWVRNAILTDIIVPLIIQKINKKLLTWEAAHVQQASSATELRAAARTATVAPVAEITVCAKPRKRKKMRENQRNELRVVSLGS